MSRQVRVLVLGVGGNVSQGIIKALRSSKLDIALIGACISPSSAGLYLCDLAYISPYANEETFIPWLIQVCNDEQIDIVLTGVEENINAIMKQYDAFTAGTTAIFKAVSYDKLVIGQDKYLTCEWLKANGCNYPKYCLLSDRTAVEELVAKIGFPLIAKPRNGKSSNGVVKVTTQEELDTIADRADYVLEECIGTSDDEYTIGCYCDKNNTFRDAVIMHRKLVNGSTDFARIVDNEAILQEVKKICDNFQPVGPLNVQLRLDKNGRPVCFELNVRFSGSTPMRAHFGYEDVKAMIKEYVLGEDISDCFHTRKGESYRYVNEIYMEAGATQQMEQDGYIKNMTDFRPSIERLEK